MKRRIFFQLVFVLFFLVTLVFAQTDKIEYETIKDIFYYEGDAVWNDDYQHERCQLDLYYPTNVENYPTVVWFHGGGITAGNKYIPQELKEQGIAVVAVNYRLYPKVKNPVYIQDAAAAVAWTVKHIEEFGGNKSLVIVSGHSAGGYLTSMVGMDKQWLAAFDVDADSLAALVPFSGHTITHFTVRQERGIPGEQPIIDAMAPLYHVRKDAPPLILITGDRNLEMLGRYEENAYMWRMMQVVEHPNTKLYEIQGFDHGGMINPACSILLDFINKIVIK